MWQRRDQFIGNYLGIVEEILEVIHDTGRDAIFREHRERIAAIQPGKFFCE